jgi:hypothetical protein
LQAGVTAKPASPLLTLVGRNGTKLEVGVFGQHLLPDNVMKSLADAIELTPGRLLHERTRHRQSAVDPETEGLSKDAKGAITNDCCQSVAHDEISQSAAGCRAWATASVKPKGTTSWIGRSRHSHAHARVITEINKTAT